MDELHQLVAGREQERAALEELLGGIELLPGGLVLVGEPGIGKTTVWRAGVARGAGLGYRVLAASPSEPERALPYTGLGDLLGEVAEEFVAALPRPQRHAIEAALFLRDAPAEGVAPRATALGLISVLRRLAEDRPVLVAVDDLQWLDSASAGALGFALRRVRSEQVAVLLARRPGVQSVVEQGFRGRFLHTLELRGVSLGALHAMCKEQLGATLARPLLRRLHETSGGNPFFALELGRALLRRGGVVSAGDALPIGADLRALLAARLDELPTQARIALAAAAALADPRLELVSAAVEGDVQTLLLPAVEGRVVEPLGDRVGFAHPLFASAALSELGADGVRNLHRRLGALVTGVEERARHLALAADGPDAEAAEALEAAAVKAAALGAQELAAEQAELALRLTPPRSPEADVRRTLIAAEALLRAGERQRVEALLKPLLSTLPAGVERAQVARVLSLATQDFAAATVLQEQVLADARGAPALEGDLHRLVGHGFARLGDLDRGRPHLSAAVACLEQSDDRAALAEALAAHVYLEMLAGEPFAKELLAKALALEGEAGCAGRLYHSPTRIKGVALTFAGRYDEARPYLEAYRRATHEHGDEGLHQYALMHLIQLECRVGRVECARCLLAELESLAIPNELEATFVAAFAGDADEARGHAAASSESSASQHDRWWPIVNLATLGSLELSLGKPAQALPLLAQALAQLDAGGYREPSFPPALPLAVEASVGVGDLGRAAELADELDRRADHLGTPWALWAAAHCRGLLAGARRDYGQAFALFKQALAEHARMQAPFEHARTLLARGIVERRARRRTEARESLRLARLAFEQMGAARWADRARDELGRVSGRRPAGDALTPTERRVAALVAEGRANKEVAAALSVTVKSVEANLSRIYAKLGLRSRSELARQFAADQTVKL